jgi:hypothetical protein
MNCWNVVEDIKLLNTHVLEGKTDGEEMTNDEISNFLTGLETIYQLKFEQMFNTFGDLVSQKQI